MRVLHVVTDTDRRGAQVFACDLDDALRKRDVDSSVIALAPGNVGGLSIDTCGGRARELPTLRELARRSAHADVVVGHGSSTLAALALVSYGASAPFVYRQISDPSYWWRGWRRLRVRAYLSRAAHVVALAPSTKGAIVALGLREARVSVIPNGVDEHSFAPADSGARAVARAQFGLPGDAFTVGYAGALVAEKGVERAIEAVAALPGVYLVIAGDGPERARLRALSERLAPERIIFVGVLSDTTHLYAALDAAVLLSRAGDSMPAAIIEANLCALPVVATRVGAIGEMIEDGKTGLLVANVDGGSARDAIGRLSSDRALARTLGSSARDLALERYTLTRVTDAWESVLCKTIARVRRRCR